MKTIFDVFIYEKEWMNLDMAVMTVCWQISAEVEREERHLRRLQELLEILTKPLNGLPQSASNSSKVEKLTVAILESENRVDRLNTVLAMCRQEFIAIIMSLIKSAVEQQVAIERYAYGRLFRDIAIKLGYSEAYIYRKHRLALEKMIVRG